MVYPDEEYRIVFADYLARLMDRLQECPEQIQEAVYDESFDSLVDRTEDLQGPVAIELGFCEPLSFMDAVEYTLKTYDPHFMRAKDCVRDVTTWSEIARFRCTFWIMLSFSVLALGLCHGFWTWLLPWYCCYVTPLMIGIILPILFGREIAVQTVKYKHKFREKSLKTAFLHLFCLVHCHGRTQA